MKQKGLFLSLCAILTVHLFPASAATDERFQPITRAEITKQIAQTPLASSQQIVIISRARISHFLDTAYNQYTLLWNKQPKNPDTNLLRGLSALFFWDDSMNLKLQPLYGIHASRTDLFPIAASCLETAAATSPKSAEAKMEYGYYLWQFGNKTTQGLSLLKKAVKLGPTDPRTHSMLGFVYAYEASNPYSAKQAIAELTQACQLDPTYAFPHAVLAEVYEQQHKASQAEQERRTYESLLPRTFLSSHSNP